MDQTFVIQGVMLYLVCSSRCLVNSLTDVSFVMVLYGENYFGATGEFFTAILRVTTGQN